MMWEVYEVAKSLGDQHRGVYLGHLACLGEAFHFVSHSGLTPCILAAFSAATLVGSGNFSIDGSR